eukprot:m.50850 g.50850  ORF g.50850 m.50850 type:complete len:275 (+) comp9029_c0_seq2:1914-2738(+)
MPAQAHRARVCVRVPRRVDLLVGRRRLTNDTSAQLSRGTSPTPKIVLRLFPCEPSHCLTALCFAQTYVLWDKSMHTYLYSVHHVTSVGNWLVAATGSGFSVFNIVTGTRVAKQRAAHGASVSKILLFGTEEELCVVTASVDAAVKIWDLSSCCPSTASSETQASPILELARKMTPISPVKSRTRKAAPRLIGHLYGHTGAVNDLIETDGFGFASCSSDRAVISWRNAVMEWQRLNEGTVKAVDHFYPEERPHTPPNGPEGPDDLQTPTKWNASV